MARKLTSPTFGQVGRVPLPIHYGGTSGADAETALKNLTGAKSTDPVAFSDPAGRVPAACVSGDLLNPPTVLGPLYVEKGSITLFEVTNFDSFTSYQLSTSAGTVRLIENQIELVAPNAATTVVVSVNGRSFTVVVLESKPKPPWVVVPADKATDQALTLQVVGSAFEMTTGVDIHQLSDWQLSTSANFASVLRSSMSDTHNLTSWNLENLDPGTKYYVRARHKGAIYGYSDWGTISSFSTSS